MSIWSSTKAAKQSKGAGETRLSKKGDMEVTNRSIYSYYLKNRDILLPVGSSVTVDDSDWESDDQLARVIETLDYAGYVFVSGPPDGYPRTRSFPLEVKIVGDGLAITKASYVDPTSETFNDDLITSLIEANLMEAS